MNNDRLTRWFVGAIAAVIVLQVLYGVLVFLLGPDMEARGQFGDIFGGINAFFTGLAFAGLIYTILLQRRELELQREELRLTRGELHTSAKAQQEQVSELQESAKLSALTALLNVYSTELEPLRDITRDSMRDLASLKARLKSEELPDYQRQEIQADIDGLQKRIADQEAEWTTLLNKHDALVVELQARVERVTQSEHSSSG
jgi:hypothetical protein